MSAVEWELLEQTARRSRRATPAGLRADPDAELVELWQGGDAKAFEALVRRHQGRVYRLLLRMLGSPHEAEDVTQEAFLSLYRHGHRFRREARFSTFLYRVATNAALNRRRSLSRSRAREQEFARRQAIGDDLPDRPRDPEGAVVGAEVQEQVQQALLSLPTDLRAALVLYDLEGQSYREIARILEIPEGTVKSRIHRGRSALRLRLKPGYGQAESGGAP
jgi:RNA polymerase sigma-70 factor (ECF subfamily)